ncbi:tetratricopeptide repeat protein [Aggregatilineales bacterium SYSU G02658]
MVRWWTLLIGLWGSLLPLWAQAATASCEVLTREETFFQIGYAEAGRDYERALQLLNCLIRQQPHDVQALHTRGRLHYQIANYESAAKDFETLLQINPQDPIAHNGRGLVSLIYEWNDLAWEDFHRAVTYKPDYAEGYFNRGRAAERMGSVREALADYQTALYYGYEPRVAVLWNMAMLYERTGDTAGYQALLEEIIRVNVRYAPAYERLGNLMAQTGRNFDAQFYFERLAEFASERRIDPLSPQETAIRSFLRFMPLMLVVLILSGLIGGAVVQAFQRRQPVA